MHGLQTSYAIRTFNCLALMYYSGLKKKQLIFYDLFCEGLSDLPIYASMAVRRLNSKLAGNTKYHNLYWCMHVFMFVMTLYHIFPLLKFTEVTCNNN